jgi:hypothetical protein
MMKLTFLTTPFSSHTETCFFDHASFQHAESNFIDHGPYSPPNPVQTVLPHIQFLFHKIGKNPAQTLFLPSADYEVVALSLKITFGPLSPDFIETGSDYDSYDTFDDQ